MRVVRYSLLALTAGALILVSAPAAQAAFGVETFVATTCSELHETCAEEGVEPFTVPKKPSKAEAETEGFTLAGGHVPFGITDFKLTTKGAPPKEVPEGALTHIRTDVAPGLATSPAAVPQCSESEFGVTEAVPGTGFYPESNCKSETKVGAQKALVYAGEVAGDVPLEGSVYNLVQRAGLASEFGVALKLPKGLTEGILGGVFKGKDPLLEKAQYFAHTLIEGSVEWGKEAKGTNAGDYHDYFEITVSPALPLIRSRLTFFGTSGEGDFITNATNCPGNLTTTLHVTDSEGVTPPPTPYTSPIGLSGCNEVPFVPSFSLLPSTTQHDEADGPIAELSLPRHPKANEIDSAQLKTASIVLPEGMTLNESAARELEACTPAQARIHSATPGVACPSGAKIGTVSINVPTLPPGSLEGSIYLGGPESGPITGPPYIVYLDAESARYGVSVRLKGEVIPNEATGQLTTVFSENPEQPFTSVVMHFKTGVLAPVANPLGCGTATTLATFTPFSPETPSHSPGVEPFSVDSNGLGGACSSPLPFAPTQSTEDQTAIAGAHTSSTINFTRPSGQQYPSTMKTTLPAGLVGAIPVVPRCEEPQAREGTCSAASQIGTASIEAGAGPAPFPFSGPVYLTGPYNGAPYGLSIPVPAVAGPFNLGVVVTRATINVDPYTDRVTVAATLPKIVKGVLVRFRKITVAVNKQDFLSNPTNCGPLATESTLTGYTPGSSATATVNLSTPFSVSECGKLAFTPSFKAKTSSKTSKTNGASLETTINQAPGQANIKSVFVRLPKQLPSRLTTLQKACPEQTFAANPFSCPAGSLVGSARANTPLLPSKVTGPAFLVSHAAAAFPDLDLVLEANGVRTILVGNTDIKNGITSSNFAASPDVPVTSFTLNLPTGPHSLLGGFGNFCATPLVMPTTITGQNGKQVTQTTKISVSGCGVKIVGHKVIGNTAYLTIQTFAAGRISGTGAHLGSVFRRLNGPARATTLKVPLSGGARRPLRTRIRVGFVPKQRGLPNSSAFVTVSFR